ARIPQADRNQVRPVLARRRLQRAGGHRCPERSAPDLADPQPGDARRLQRRRAGPDQREQLPVEHPVDFQAPGPPRRPAGRPVHPPGDLERRGGRAPDLAARPRYRRLHGPLAAGRGQPRQGRLDGGRLYHELRAPPLFRLPEGGAV
ncbi:MAG: hypothetical protein AVDCRST_MAG01-01-2706, partial [uncultured Rubrobacteraceae bacterium]